MRTEFITVYFPSWFLPKSCITIDASNEHLDLSFLYIGEKKNGILLEKRISSIDNFDRVSKLSLFIRRGSLVGSILFFIRNSTISMKNIFS